MKKIHIVLATLFIGAGTQACAGDTSNDRSCSGWEPGQAPSDVGWANAVTTCAAEADIQIPEVLVGTPGYEEAEPTFNPAKHTWLSPDGTGGNCAWFPGWASDYSDPYTFCDYAAEPYSAAEAGD